MVVVIPQGQKRHDHERDQQELSRYDKGAAHCASPFSGDTGPRAT
jgi:hypothetical protein